MTGAERSAAASALAQAPFHASKRQEEMIEAAMSRVLARLGGRRGCDGLPDPSSFSAVNSRFHRAAGGGEPGWVRVRWRVERLDWVPSVLAGLGLPFVIEEPDDLRDRVRALADRLAAWAEAR